MMSRVVFRVDASPEAGGGHWTRCVALGRALADAGVNVEFVAEESVSLSYELARDARLAFKALPETPGGRSEAEDAQLTVSMLDKERAAWLVVDHYRLASEWESLASVLADRVLVIEDFAARRHFCSHLLNQSDPKSEAQLRCLTPPACEFLLGPRYALLRPEFRMRRRQLSRTFGKVSRVLIFLGGRDSQNWTARAFDAARKVLPYAHIDVVIGSVNVNRDSIRREVSGDRRARLLVQTPEVDQLMADADLAIGAAGSATWERCCLGLPSVVLILQENQRGVARTVSDAGAAEVIPASGDGLLPALQSLADDRDRRAVMSDRALKLVDGSGAIRVRNVMFPLAVRRANVEDRRKLWNWANDAKVRKSAIQQEEISWEEHVRWFQTRLASDNCRIFIGEVDGLPVGQVRFDRKGYGAEIDISLDAEWRGKGFAEPLLRGAVEACRRDWGGIPLDAVVRQENRASQGLFESAGFKRIESCASPALIRFRL